MIIPEPYGRVFIISPWNYPFQLPLIPLIGAIAAGNVVIIRQSRFSPNTNAIIKVILAESFPEEHAAIIECDLETAEAAIKLRWDLIFFTGSTQVGRKIYIEAARNLTPVILELGGKSPVIVENDADIKTAARRIVWGKLINAGQTCISPDYLFVNEGIKDALISQIKHEIKTMYGENPTENRDYPKMISEKAFDRIESYFVNARIIEGGRTDRKKLSIEPTLLDATYSDKCMEEEIFGPVLPVITYKTLNEAITYINSKEKPLAVYFFSSDKKKQNRVIRETSSGACLINDVILHIANNNLPFGGVGESGTGRYHGKESFRAFSNMKAVMKSASIIDIPIKYPPFKNKERLIRMFLK
jgi:acyl-CoA reductase-like NAD-dependent aldehyde dehydrogenase